MKQMMPAGELASRSKTSQLVGIDSNDWHIKQHEVGHRSSMISGKSERHHRPRIMTNNRKPLVPQMIVHQLPHVSSNRLLIIPVGGTGGSAQAPQIRRDQQVLVG